MAVNLDVLRALLALNQGDLPPLPDPAKPLPIPLAPVPNLGPLSTETTAAYGALNPEPVPPRFIQPAPVDTNFVSQESGPAPTPPAPPSRLGRILNAIAGFGAGVQGQGPQFLEQLQQPQREYQRQVERYQGRRAQATELAERREERRADQENRALELTYQRDYNEWLSKNKDRSAEAKLRMQQAFQLQRDANAARLDEERTQRRERAQQERDARTFAAKLGSGPGAARPEIAEELGNYYAKLTDKLSPAAAKYLNAQAQKAQILASRAAGGGGGTGGGNAESLERQFNSLKARFLRAEQGTPRSPRGDRALMERIAKQFTAVMDKLAKLGYEVGFDPSGIYPYIKPPQGQQPAAQAAPQSQQADPLGIR